MRLELLVLLLTASVQDNDAEKLFRKMETKIVKAKTIQVSFEATIDGPGKGMIKGTLSLAEGDKIRLQGSGEFDGKMGKILMISDGVKMKTREEKDGEGKERLQDTPKNLGGNIKYAIKSIGLVGGFFVGIAHPKAGEEFKIEELIPVSEFKLGKKEMVGDRQAQIVEYKAAMPSGGPKDKSLPAFVRVWIDLKTNLPLKQVLAAEERGKQFTFVQTYTEFRVDEKVDAKLFELPK